MNIAAPKANSTPSLPAMPSSSIVVAVMAGFAAPATYLIAARFLAGRFAFLAGLLVATSLLHICYSVQARPHAVVSTFSTLAILSAIRWRETPSLWRAVLLGLSVAASVSTLHSGAAALAPDGAAFLGLLRGGAPMGRVALGTLIAATIIAVSAGWFYIRAEDGYAIALRTLQEYDPVILFFAALGLLGMSALALRRRSPGSAVLIILAYGIPTFLMFGIYQLSTARFYLALVPITCLLAAFGMSPLCTMRIPAVVTKGLVSAGVVSMLAAAILIARLRAAPDTFELAAQEVEELKRDAAPPGLHGRDCRSAADGEAGDLRASLGFRGLKRRSRGP